MGQLSELHGRLLRLKLAARAAFVEAGQAEERRSPPGAIESKALADATENLWRMLDALYGKANFNPNQPRVPRGNPDGGQWTDGAAYGGATAVDADTEDETAGATEVSIFESLREELGPDFFMLLAGVGHHYMPVSILKKIKFRADTRRVFDKATVGPTNPKHQYSKEHAIYNELIGERLVSYATRKRIRLEDMTPDHAREFLEEIRNPPDAVGRFNRKERRLHALWRALQRRMR